MTFAKYEKHNSNIDIDIVLLKVKAEITFKYYIILIFFGEWPLYNDLNISGTLFKYILDLF